MFRLTPHQHLAVIPPCSFGLLSFSLLTPLGRSAQRIQATLPPRPGRPNSPKTTNARHLEDLLMLMYYLPPYSLTSTD